MSSILKALKKLEEEKSLLEEHKEINVSREILKQHSEKGKLVTWLWLLGSSAALVIIILSSALLHKSAPKEAISTRELPAVSRPGPVSLPLQSLPSPPAIDGRDKGVRTLSPLPASEPKQQPAEPAIALPVTRSLKTQAIELPDTATPPAEPQKREPLLKAAPPAAPLKSEPSLTLSGIAWNKDSADRLAIINGQQLAIGATVNGVIVEEIMPDRVKLSHNGLSFELLLGKSTPVNQGKPDYE